MSARTQAFYVALLALIGIGTVIAHAIHHTGNVVAGFEYISNMTLSAAGTFMGVVVVLPRIFRCKPVVAALIASIILIAVTLIQQFWLDEFLHGMA